MPGMFIANAVDDAEASMPIAPLGALDTRHPPAGPQWRCLLDQGVGVAGRILRGFERPERLRQDVPLERALALSTIQGVCT